MATRSRHRGRSGYRVTVGEVVRNYSPAVHFDGANSSLSIASLACTDGGLLSFAYFIRTDASQNGKSVWVVDPAGDYGSYGYFLTAQNIQHQLSNAGATLNVTVDFSGAISTGAWHSVVGCFDINHASPDKAVKIYVDRVDVTAIGSESADAVIAALNGLPFFLGDDDAGAGFTGDLANFWFAPNQSILTNGDISVETLNKFVAADNKPINLGSDGSTPTGIAPAVYFSGNASAFVTNRGTGGAFTAVNITNAATSPSD